MAHRKTGRPTPDLEALERFAALGDRRSSPFFAGPREEMEAVERLCAEALAVARRGGAMEGATLLFQGAPGAGKTALFSEMSRRWARGETVRGGAAPIAVPVFPGDLADEAVVAAGIARAVDPETERSWRETETRDIAGQAGIPGLGRVGGSRRTATAPPAPSLGELCRRFPPSSWVRPVCLAVDEVQTVREAATDVLVKLHSGLPGLPVVPVLAGLGNGTPLRNAASHGWRARRSATWARLRPAKPARRSRRCSGPAMWIAAAPWKTGRNGLRR